MLERAKRVLHIDPPASSYAIMRRARPYRGENPEPGKDVHGELDPWPGIREQAGSSSASRTAATQITMDTAIVAKTPSGSILTPAII